MTTPTAIQKLSGLELRKALCEALGWEQCRDSHEGRLRGFCGTWIPPDRLQAVVATSGLPALESDPAAFWPAFETWLREKKWHAEAQICFAMPEQESTSAFIIKRCLIVTEEWVGFGSSMAEAGCRAWLMALHSMEPK